MFDTIYIDRYLETYRVRYTTQPETVSRFSATPQVMAGIPPAVCNMAVPPGYLSSKFFLSTGFADDKFVLYLCETFSTLVLVCTLFRLLALVPFVVSWIYGSLPCPPRRKYAQPRFLESVWAKCHHVSVSIWAMHEVPNLFVAASGKAHCPCTWVCIVYAPVFFWIFFLSAVRRIHVHKPEGGSSAGSTRHPHVDHTTAAFVCGDEGISHM